MRTTEDVNRDVTSKHQDIICGRVMFSVDAGRLAVIAWFPLSLK